jgi:hypothetical protein
MQYKKKVEWFKKHQILSQAISSGLEYAFVSADYKQCCPFVLCKDFLHDAVYNAIHNTKKSIYQFHYSPKDGHAAIDLTKMRIILANSCDRQLREKIPHCLDFIHQIERVLRMSLTTARECVDPPPKYAPGGVWLFESSRRWLAAPPMVSLYTLLARVGFSHTQGENFQSTIDKILSYSIQPYQYEDKHRLSGSKNGIDYILKHGDRRVFHSDLKMNYPRIRISVLHNDCGIMGFARGSTKKIVPNWHRFEENKV